jgi:hypothetical protein
MTRAAATGTRKPTAVATAPSSPQARPAATTPQIPPIGAARPTADQVRQRAYQIYLERTAKGDRGDAAADWLRAERELAHK